MMFFGLLLLLYWLTIKSFIAALYLACITYLTISLSVRLSITRKHRKGAFLCKGENYKAAIIEFEKSYEFFTKHKWIDTYRYITLLSSSRISYTEMALLNIAFCSSQIGDGITAKKYYEKTLEQFPDSEVAKTSLTLIRSIENQLID